MKPRLGPLWYPALFGAAVGALVGMAGWFVVASLLRNFLLFLLSLLDQYPVPGRLPIWWPFILAWAGVGAAVGSLAWALERGIISAAKRSQQGSATEW
jgi:hypothetical protein